MNDPLIIGSPLTAVAFCAGVIDAIAGGGGLLTVPALLFTGIDTHSVFGTNKGQSVWGSLGAHFAVKQGAPLIRRVVVTVVTLLVLKLGYDLWQQT